MSHHVIIAVPDADKANIKSLVTLLTGVDSKYDFEVGYSPNGMDPAEYWIASLWASDGKWLEIQNHIPSYPNVKILSNQSSKKHTTQDMANSLGLIRVDPPEEESP